jgi:hypothetical protein
VEAVEVVGEEEEEGEGEVVVCDQQRRSGSGIVRQRLHVCARC